jgi:hypothetical protein
MVQDDYLNYIQNTVQSRNQDVFYHNARDNFFPVIRRVNEYGGYVFANPWTAPGEFKTTNSPRGGAWKTDADSYRGYALWLRGFLEWLNANNAPIFCIGIVNEPDMSGSADYEGMNVTNTQSRDFFRTVGHFTTQTVTLSGTSTTGSDSTFTQDIIPGYGGGRPTHHVLSMSGDSMGNVAAYMNPQLGGSTGENGSNNRNEVIGRHYYSNSSRYTELVGSATTAWADRILIGEYVGPYEGESLAFSPQMYAPGSFAGDIKRECWQTEHDFNYQSQSVYPPAGNPQNFWNSAFACLNDVDWCLRVAGESVFDWWFSSSYSGLVMSYQQGTFFPPRTITSRGRAWAHYARYVNETWLLDISRTAGTINFNATGTTSTTFNAGSTDPKISAFEDVDGKFINIVMFTPSTSTNNGSIGSGFGAGGTNGNDTPTRGSTNVGRIEVVLPNGFEATSATAMRSYGHSLVPATPESWDTEPSGSPRYWINEPAILSADGKSVEVTLAGGTIISIQVKGEWTGAQLENRIIRTGDKKRVSPHTVGVGPRIPPLPR